jgi:hypothetical protein
MDPDLTRRIVELEKALAYEREVSARERRRAELLEETARRAYRFVAAQAPRREPATEDTE